VVALAVPRFAVPLALPDWLGTSFPGASAAEKYSLVNEFVGVVGPLEGHPSKGKINAGNTIPLRALTLLTAASFINFSCDGGKPPMYIISTQRIDAIERSWTHPGVILYTLR